MNVVAIIKMILDLCRRFPLIEPILSKIIDAILNRTNSKKS
jgi:hypothetical protein